jgi:hypothetical protein
VQDQQPIHNPQQEHQQPIPRLQGVITVKQPRTTKQDLLKIQPQQIQPTTITTPIQETLGLCLQHLLLVSLLCLKILCTVGVGLGIQKPLIGGSIGITKRDMNCERMKLSKLLFDFNMKVAAVSILCQDNRVFSAMAHAGTPCPFNGKIGDSALEEWNKYDQQRPDYEEYTKALRYMEKVDNKILEGLDEKEAYITDGNGNPVKLGSE